MRYKLVIEYDGTPFCGWQRQAGHLTVQAVLENALQICLKHDIGLFGSGRTDTGVHAVGQVAHFDTDRDIDCFKLRESLNALVRPHPIAVRDVQPVSDGFHARFSAKERFYVYKIQNTRFPPILQKNRVWHVATPLDVDNMNIAAALLVGKHDFSTFRATECQAKSPIKTINRIFLERSGEFVVMHISARSFLHHQVRNIIGTLALVGRGKWTIKDFETAFQSCDRKKGGPTAPPQGLYFDHVVYE